MKEGGVACTNMRIDDDHDEAMGVIESGDCDVGLGEESLDIVIAAGERKLQSVLDEQEISGETFVVGDVWAVGAEQEATAENVQEAIGGELEN